MDWNEIMKMQNPHEALKAIMRKAEAEMTPLEEVENRVEQYANLHKIEVDEMAFYPNGEKVLDN